MARYNWGINGQSLDMADPGALRFLMRQGRRVRVISPTPAPESGMMAVLGYQA